MGLVAVEGMEFFAYHGYYQQEKENGNSFIVDIYIDTALEQAAQSDKLNDTVNYERVYQITAQVMGERHNLRGNIEWQIMEKLHDDRQGVNAIKIRISKLNPPLKGKVNRTFIELKKNYNQ